MYMIFGIIRPSVFENWAQICPKTQILGLKWPSLAYFLNDKATKQ